MHHQRRDDTPANGDRLRLNLSPWMGKTVRAVFLLALGWLANQFLSIPRQQAKLEALDVQVKALQDQHMVMLSNQAALAADLKGLKEQVATLQPPRKASGNPK